MNNEYIEYKPNQTYTLFVPFLALGEILFVLLSGAALQARENLLFVVACILAILGGISTKYFYDSLNTIIFFETDGLRILNDKHIKHYYILWENLLYGYYCKNYKGHLFLVLSKESLETKKVKKIVEQSAMQFKTQIDNVIVIRIYNGEKEEIKHIKEMVSKKILVIKEI